LGEYYRKIESSIPRISRKEVPEVKEIIIDGEQESQSNVRKMPKNRD
jgi:hypothetical protein